MKRTGSALAGFLAGVIFGAVRIFITAAGGHGLLAEQVLCGSPFSVFDPRQMGFLGSLLFWGLLGLFWRSVRIRRYLVLSHVVAATVAFALVPEYRDWHRLQHQASLYYRQAFLIVMLIHIAALLLAVFYEGPKGTGHKGDNRDKRWDQRWD
jgi:hypothetical protein